MGSNLFILTESGEYYLLEKSTHHLMMLLKAFNIKSAINNGKITFETVLPSHITADNIQVHINGYCLKSVVVGSGPER